MSSLFTEVLAYDQRHPGVGPPDVKWLLPKVSGCWVADLPSREIRRMASVLPGPDDQRIEFNWLPVTFSSRRRQFVLCGTSSIS